MVNCFRYYVLHLLAVCCVQEVVNVLEWNIILFWWGYFQETSPCTSTVLISQSLLFCVNCDDHPVTENYGLLFFWYGNFFPPLLIPLSPSSLESEGAIDPTLIQLDLGSAIKELNKFKRADKMKKLKLGGKHKFMTHTFHISRSWLIADSS